MLSPPRAKHLHREILHRVQKGVSCGRQMGSHQITIGPRQPIFLIALSLVCSLAVLGCAAPGEPQPRRSPVPQAVTDLAVRQSGDSVVLTFTLPRKTVESQPLPGPPAVEIYRGLVPAGARPERLPTRLVYTIPGALADTYLVAGRMRFVDPLRPEEAAQNAGGQIVYMVRTRASKRRASADSNTAALRVYPAPAPIGELRATVTQAAIELAWTPPAQTSSGAPLPTLAGYRIYRGEVEPGAEVPAAQELAHVKWKTPLELVGPAPSPAFRDTQFEFGRAYLYTVRSVAQYAADEVESADSQPLVVTPRDTFPPAAPGDLVAVLVAETPGVPTRVELSWEISLEPDWAGYHVYRSEGEDALGERLTRELLLVPTFRDMSVVAGRRYFYRVTAVDRTGNESPPSTAVSVEVPPAADGER